ncbi:unnamed protein product [Musa hybrid cultivar]
MSCNGCRVLRKGCSDGCTIRPCLQWIRSPEAQANATVFLAKFYGRAGLINLINAGPPHLRPAIYRSLLYEACGRIIDPVYGSVGLLWSGSWRLCQAAVESVLLRGEPATRFPADATAPKPYDIRYMTRIPSDIGAGANCDLHKVTANSRVLFKRSANALRPPSSPSSDPFAEGMHQTEAEGKLPEETVQDDDDDELDLTLGFEPAARGAAGGRGPVIRQNGEGTAWFSEGCPEDLLLRLR